MPDNPKKKKLDGKRISQQPWEQAYQRRKNARKKADTVATVDVQRRNVLLARAGLWISYNGKLESALLKMEKALSENPIRGKDTINFCKEWEAKGKPIFNMVLALFTFNAKAKTTIKRIMNGIDGVCLIPEPVTKP